MGFEGGVVQHAVVQVHDLEDVQQLALVRMEALDLHVEDGIQCSDGHAAGTLDVCGEPLLVRALGRGEAVEEGLIVGEGLELLELRGVAVPSRRRCAR